MSETLPAHLAAALARAQPAALCVAFSGGPDSTALLHALTQLSAARTPGLRALHVDHGLHADSARWAQHCTDFCARLGVPLQVIRVTVDDAADDGIEAAARHARYAAFASNLRDGEWLALAHHRDDQVETILLKLLRGAGPEGLGGMRAVRPLAGGMLWRPLLDAPRAMLRGYLAGHALVSIDDPANADPRFARSVLRRAVLPMLRQNWPHADAAILHSARLCRIAADHLAEAGAAELAALRRADATLDARGWLALPAALRAPVLDAWLHARGLPAPPDTARGELERQVQSARTDRVPLVRWPDAEVRVWDGRLHAMQPLAPPPGDWSRAWDGGSPALPPGCGSLTMTANDGTPAHHAAASIPPTLTIQFRRGGERIQPAGDPHTRALRDLFQRARVPPWLRTRCPLVFLGDELVAVADLWTSERGSKVFAARGIAPCWTHPA